MAPDKASVEVMARIALNDMDDPRKMRLLEWLITAPQERDPATRAQLAELMKLSDRVLAVWQKQPAFREMWEARAKEVAGSPERTKAVLDTLFQAATDPANRSQVQAAKLYLEATNAIKPPAVEVTVKKATELSDEELDALLASGAAELREKRDAAAVSRADNVVELASREM